MNPEIYEYVMEKLFQNRARDVWFTPIHMKKNRPAVMLSVLASQIDEVTLVKILLEETSSLGVRIHRIERHEAKREVKEFNSSLGVISIKIKLLSDQTTSISPEYSDCRRLALEKNLPLLQVYRIVTAEAGKKFLTHH